jgi:two-component system response regulator PilR (NtrC family)
MNASQRHRLLVVDDEPDLRTLYELTLLREGYHIDTAGSVGEALDSLAEHRFSLVITDMRLPDGTGLDILKFLEAEGRREKAVVITAYGSADNAVAALKAGAYDYLTKPVDLKQFRAVVAAGLDANAGEDDEPRTVPGSLDDAPTPTRAPQSVSATRASGRGTSAAPGNALARLIGNSPAIQHTRVMIDKVSRSMAPVLLSGESGTGKELVARAVHDGSPRRARPFLAVNCGAIPEQLLEAEFFGYRKGAFTGANEDREGFFQAAQGGTLFLDEIGDLPLSMQSKLLRAIQERAARPIGTTQEVPVDVRLVSATHKDLQQEVQAGRFRQDLFYRLNVIQVSLPPLRDRREDLPQLAQRITERLAAEAGFSTPPRLSPEALQSMQRYAFPGNVRELENMLLRALALSNHSELTPDDLGLSAPTDADILLPLGMQDAAAMATPSSATAADGPAPVAPAVATPLPSDLVSHLDQVERDILIQALNKHRLNRTAAGTSLGLSLRQMRYRMARLGVQVGDQGIVLGPPQDTAPSELSAQDGDEH